MAVCASWAQVFPQPCELVRAAGASSMRPGQLEVMLNRRTALSDELGNPEKMDEQEGGAGACSHLKCHSLHLMMDHAAVFPLPCTRTPATM